MRRHPLPAIAVALGLVALLSSATGARAQGDDRWADAYQQAKADIPATRFDDALAICWRALGSSDLEPERRWGFLVGAGLAYEGLNQPIHALEVYHRLLRDLDAVPGTLPEVWAGRRDKIGSFLERFEREVLPARGAIRVESAPLGALVEVDGKGYGPDGAATTPTTLYLPPGEHTIRVRADGFQAREARVRAVAGIRGDARLVLMEEPTRGRLVINAGAPDAQVIVDDLARGLGPTVEVEVPLGPRLVRVERPGFATFEAEVTLEPDQPAFVAVTWQPLSPAPATPGPALEATGWTRPAWLTPLWGWVMLGSGAAVTAVGVPFTLRAKSDFDGLAKLETADPNDPAAQDKHGSLSSSLKTNQAVAGVMYGLGGAALVGGAVWLALAYTGHAPADEAPALGWAPLPGGGALTFQTTW